MPKMVRAHIIIEGVVQGVFFRANTADIASTNSVTGWVRNNPDGSVEAVFEGEEENVKNIVAWCRTGPKGARVDRVNAKWEEYKNEFDDFTAITRHNSY
ncbi:MAG: acylphosphatase [Deltaproteobacteria bacterium]|nr:acylphosphatase [Deltaproteobacteria bacterium]